MAALSPAVFAGGVDTSECREMQARQVKYLQADQTCAGCIKPTPACCGTVTDFVVETGQEAALLSLRVRGRHSKGPSQALDCSKLSTQAAA